MRWALPLLLLYAGCGGPLLAVFEGPLLVPDEADALELTVRSTRGGEAVQLRQRFGLEGPTRPLSEGLELLEGDALRNEVELRVIALLGEERIASGARVVDLDDDEVNVRLTPWQVRGCEDPDGDEHGDGPGCVDFDCDESDASVNASAEEQCNGVDDDCDFRIDEGCPCLNGAFLECGNREGVCTVDAQVCAASSWEGCDEAGQLRGLELCDGRDNDCDGRIDEGCQ